MRYNPAPMGLRIGPGRAASLRAAAAALAAALVASPTGAVAEASLKVLLREGDAPVRVQDARGQRFTLSPTAHGLRANGRPSGARWTRDSGPSGSLVADGVRVRGALEVARVPEGLRVVNRVPLEAYVAGTLGREVYPDWAAELMKAQAVVTRTYALHQRAREPEAAFHLRAGTRSQVYGGADAETPAVLAAAAATRGEYLAHDGEPILAVFHSASGGRTASAEEVWGQPLPYLVSVEVPFEEDSPDTYWRASISGTTLGRALGPPDVGVIDDVRVLERSPSGRVLRVELQGERGARTLDGRAVRTALGESVIRSTLFDIRKRDGVIVFVGSGHGHGVGMSQWGAQALALRGESYRQILARFYPGTVLRRPQR